MSNAVAFIQEPSYVWFIFVMGSGEVVGKRAKGYWGANIPADTKKLEIHIKDGYGTDTSAVFILDVPPVESITPDEYFASID